MNINNKSFYDNNIGNNNSPLIGLFINNLYNFYEAEIYDGINKGIEEANANIISFVGGSFNNPHFFINNNGKNYVYSLASKSLLDGLIVISSSIGSYISNKKFSCFLKRYSDIPIVSIGTPFKNISSIVIDNENAIIKLFDHLINFHGYKKIAFIKGPDNNIDAIIRFKAYKKCLSDNNIPYDENLIFQSSYSGDFNKEIMDKIINLKKLKINAIICINDYVGLKIIEEFNKQGIKVPDDIAVVGFDNVFESNLKKYSLTTINQPTFDLGYNSVKMILSLINDNKQINTEKLECKLIIRNSCGCTLKKKDNKEMHEVLDLEEKRQFDVYDNLSIVINQNILNKMEFIQFKRKLNSVTNLKDFEQIIKNVLALMSIKRCYIGLYKTPEVKESKLILAYDNNMPDKKNKDFYFPSSIIIPEGLKNLISKKNIFIFSLHFFEENLGYIIFEVDLNKMKFSNIVTNEYGDLFESFSIAVSNTLNNILLYNKTKISLLKKSGENIEKKIIKDYTRKYCLPEKTGKAYYIKLIELMKTEKPFINPDLTLIKLAEMMNISRSHLSFIINVYTNQKFYDFINSFRIEEAKILLQKNSDNKLSILDIAYLSGFNSKATFNRVFKIITNLTPKEYKKKFSGL